MLNELILFQFFQGSASECILVCMLAARAQAITKLKESTQYSHLDETVLLGKLMAYCSRESHSCVEKDAMICFVRLRILEPDEKSILQGETLQQVIMKSFCNIRSSDYFVSIKKKRINLKKTLKRDTKVIIS